MQQESALRSNEILKPELNLFKMIGEVASYGYSFRREALTAKACKLLLHEATQPNYEEVKQINYKGKTVASEIDHVYEQATFATSSPELPLSAKFVVAHLTASLRKASPRLEVLSDWRPNQLEYQSYRTENDHIGPHWDIDDILLSANLTVSGEGLARIHKTEYKWDYNSREHRSMITETRKLKLVAGSLLLLSAEGFGEVEPVLYEVHTSPGAAGRLALNLTMRDLEGREAQMESQDSIDRR